MSVMQILDRFEDQGWDDDTVLGLLERFIDEQSEKDTGLSDKLERFLEIAAGKRCANCGEEMDTCCRTGEPRCPNCDGPCPGCSDGPGPGEDTDEEEDEEDTGLTLEEMLADRAAERDLP